MVAPQEARLGLIDHLRRFTLNTGMAAVTIMLERGTTVAPALTGAC